MKLFDTREINQFVFAVVSKNAREGTPPEFKCCGTDSIESCEKLIEQKGQRNAYPHCMGRYDEKGRYCIYKPPLEGVSPGRFVVHPVAEEAYQVDRRELNYA